MNKAFMYNSGKDKAHKAFNCRFKQNRSRLQYWMYANLKSWFGSSLEINRDPLHSRYDVNKHSFYVQTHIKSPEELTKEITQRLEKLGFKVEKKWGLIFAEKSNSFGDKWGYSICKNKQNVNLSPYFYEGSL